MNPLTKAFTYLLLSIWAFTCLFPIYWVGITSIKSIDDIDRPPGYMPFVDYAPSLEAWRFILLEHNENLVTRLVNSTVIGIIATLLTIAISAMAIYGLTRFRQALRWSYAASTAVAIGCGIAALVVSASVSRIALLAGALTGLALALGFGRRGPVISASGLTFMLLATRVLPPVVIVLPLYILAQATGSRDTWAIMIFVYTAINIPVAVWLLLPVLGSRASEEEESAQLDGASHFSILFTILLPMVRASVMATGLIVFLMCWNEYLFAVYLTADNALTLPPWAVGQISIKEAQVGGEAEELAHLSAATILMMVPTLPFAAIVLRHLGISVARR